MKEMQQLEHSPPEDIQVIANENNLTDIQAWIRGPNGTPYENGYFKVRLMLADGFPDLPPKGHFLTKIFHPNVSASGEICVSTLKKDWKPDLGIAHIFLTIKCLLIVPNPESALNEEAGKLLLEHYNDYARRARLYTSIHAKNGKNEYQALAQQRVQPDEEKKYDTTPNASEDGENPVKNSAIKQDDKSAISSAKASSVNVLTTSAVSNAAVSSIPSNPELKRSASKALGDSVNITKQPRTEDMIKKKPVTVKDKKKSLRRL
ncbi:ubiquitin-conjugating enzyme/RWD-like protein [Radiomyces spectabilis]|uniref:ubiquitin-conjugating enzyme/RWD-like protein n=1 Tax=Radiomyces spectabilis TaxID=64574 RepID=UPI0022206AA5|nr:ubiquitin-conjugating enzyme/RWD-like protein [Radiomyces spectabilis]KAI8369250.1 ubiquitin-conjugating enzyme/RWD-like protein [Radiomyces spectabilis]